MTNALSLRPGDRVPDFALPGPRRQAAQVHLVVHRRSRRPARGRRSRQSGCRAVRRPVAACKTCSVVPVVVAGNAVAAAAAPWAKLGGPAESPCCCAIAERKFLPPLLAQGGVGLRSGRRPAHARDRARSQPAHRRDLRQPRPAGRRRSDGRHSPTPCAPTAARDQVMLHADGARPGAAARVRARVLRPGDSPVGKGRPQGQRRLQPLRQRRHARISSGPRTTPWSSR